MREREQINYSIHDGVLMVDDDGIEVISNHMQREGNLTELDLTWKEIQLEKHRDRMTELEEW